MNDETEAALKIAQPFKAGFTVGTKPQVPQGRQNIPFVPAGTREQGCQGTQR